MLGCAARHPNTQVAGGIIDDYGMESWLWPLAANMPGCPDEVAGILLANIAQDQNAKMRLEAVRNPRCPASAVVRLLGDPDREVQRTAAAHPALPSYLRAMWRFAQVQTAAGQTTTAAEQEAKDCWWEAQGSACPAGRLDELARDPRVEIRQAVAINRACSPETLNVLARDPTLGNVGIRRLVAVNRSCSPETLNLLASDRDRFTCQEVAKNRCS
jgi:hypothetical protein